MRQARLGLIPPQGTPAEIVISPSGRFTAQIWRCCDVYNYISGFRIYDEQTGRLYRQDMHGVEGLSAMAGGVFFEWTPSENYLVLVTDNRVTSHGCDEVLIYTGNGNDLVYNTAPTSLCKLLMADANLHSIELCTNDEVIYSLANNVYRVTPVTGQTEVIDSMMCGG